MQSKCLIAFYQSVVENRNCDGFRRFQRVERQRTSLRNVILPCRRRVISCGVIKGSSAAEISNSFHSDVRGSSRFVDGVIWTIEYHSDKACTISVEPRDSASVGAVQFGEVTSDKHLAVRLERDRKRSFCTAVSSDSGRKTPVQGTIRVQPSNCEPVPRILVTGRAYH